MYQQDYLLNEARKLAQLLARLMGLKAEGKQEEYTQEFDQMLQSEYDIELEQLLALNEDAFKQRVQNAGYSPGKLNALSQLLYIFAEPFNAIGSPLLLKKVMMIFDVLEQKHHFDSFENIEKRKIIIRFLKSIYE